MKKASYLLPFVLVVIVSYGGIIWSVADVVFGRAHWDAGHATIIFIPLAVLACALTEWFLFKDLNKLPIISSLATFFVVTIIWSVFDLISDKKHPGVNPLADIIIMLLLAFTCAFSVWFVVKATVFATSRLFRNAKEMNNVPNKLPSPILLATFTFFGVIILSVVAIITMTFVYGDGNRWADTVASLSVGILMFALFCALDVWFLVTAVVNIVGKVKSIFANLLAVITLLGIIVFGVYTISKGIPGDGLIAIIIYIPIFALVCASLVWLLVSVIVFIVNRLFRLMVKGKALQIKEHA